MNPLLVAALAFLAGATLAWMLAAARLRSRFEAELRELSNARSASESAAGELRKQLEAVRNELAAARQSLAGEQTGRASAETALEKSRENLQEQRQAFDEAKARLTEAFQALAASALSESSKQFLDLAAAKFETLQKEAAGDLEKRKLAVQGFLDPLNTSLQGLREQIGNLEASRQKAYGELTTQVQQLTESSRALREETGSLVTSLRQPQIKGKWGELTLRRAAELTGMSPHCDFSEQVSMETEEGSLRPDMVVHLPGGGEIVVDAKVPLHAFLNALSGKTADEYRASMSDHARLVRAHVARLASKKYSDQFTQSPQLVVLFLPGESFFSAALEQDRTLIEDAMEKRVVLASPTTFLALLRAVGYGWQQNKLAEDAQQIAELGKDLHERILVFLKYFDDIRAGLERTNKAYNQAVASAESRLLPGARKLKALAAPSGEELPLAEPIEISPRQLAVPEDAE